jgi:hypothetical protein
MLQCVKKDHIVYCIQIKSKDSYKYLIDIPPELDDRYNKELGIKWMIKTQVAFYPIPIAEEDWLVFEYDHKTGFPIKVIPNEYFRKEHMLYVGHNIRTGLKDHNMI